MNKVIVLDCKHEKPIPKNMKIYVNDAYQCRVCKGMSRVILVRA